MTAFVVVPVPGPGARPLRGRVEVPGDKSIAHRALILSALCDGPVRVEGLGAGADNRRTARALQRMGVVMEPVGGAGDSGDALGDALLVHGVGLDGLRAPAAADPIDCGNSGTTIRLLCGLLAAQPFATVLVGDDSLARRPMRRVIDPLRRMGAVVSGSPRPALAASHGGGGDDASAAADGDPGYLPLTVGPCPGAGLDAIDYAMPVASAQVKTALLLAGLYARGVTRVIEPGAARDHTERMLAHMGAPLRVRPADTGDTEGTAGAVIELGALPGQPAWDRRLRADRLVVPRDPSQAAFLVAAGLLAGADRVVCPGVCVNPTRIGFLDVLAAMGARVDRDDRADGADGDAHGGEPVADLAIGPGAGDHLVAADVSGDTTVRAIDEIPVLAVVAACADGVTTFRDAAELRVKESDRIATTAALLRALGVDVQTGPDTLTVVGRRGRTFSAARIHARGDHRIAMAAAVAGARADGPVRVDGAECTDTSFPGFADLLRGLGVDIRVE